MDCKRIAQKTTQFLRVAAPLETGHIPKATRQRVQWAMLEMQKELAALMAWDYSDLDLREGAELDAVGRRLIRMAELIRKIREKAQLN